MENLEKRTGTSDASITNRIQETEERILSVDDIIEEIDMPVKENVKSKKIPYTKHPGNLRYHEKT